MNRRLALAIGIAASLLGGAPGVARPADPAAPTEAAFSAALEKARALLTAGDAAAGRRTLDAALVAHEKRAYVRGKRVDLEDLVRRLAFRAECPPPDPASMVKGSLRKWVSKTGEIEIREIRGFPQDLESLPKSASLVFPARFTGPYTVTVKGDAYPSKNADLPSVRVGYDKDPATGRAQAWAIVPGIPAHEEGGKESYIPSSIYRLDGDAQERVAGTVASLTKPGQPWKLEVQVSKTKVTASINGKSIGVVAKPDKVFGYAVFDVAPGGGWDEIVLEGRIEPSWIQAKIDAVVEAKLAEFDKHFDATRHLPAWVYEAGPAADAGAPSGAFPELGEVPAPLESKVRLALEGLADDPAGALETISSARTLGLGEPAASLLEARAHLALGQPAKALADVERALAATPGFSGALTTKAEVLARLGRDEEARIAWKAATERPDAPTSVFVEACVSLLLAGALDDARRVAEDATRLGHHAAALDALGRVLVQAKNGPAWPRTYSYKSNNYDVSSDIDVETCQKASQVLEEALSVYRAQVHALKSERRTLYRVFLFGGEAGFGRYMADLTSLSGRKPENVAGIYSPLVKQLLIWNLPRREEMYETVRHEGFHQYLDRLLPDPPVWFNEGMATYYESMRAVGGQPKPGEPRRESLDLLKEKPLVPCAKFLQLTPGGFYAGGRHSYAQAWLLVHLLRHGTGRYRDAYKALLAKLETTAAFDAVSAVFDEKLLAGIDADLEAYRQSLTK